jgi:hypothetical protein
MNLAEGVIAEAAGEPTSDDVFAQGLREDSNLEMDWLWLATQVRTDGQRAYCLRRALRINPRSALATRGLRQLRRRPGKPLWPGTMSAGF